MPMEITADWGCCAPKDRSLAANRARFTIRASSWRAGKPLTRPTVQGFEDAPRCLSAPIRGARLNPAREPREENANRISIMRGDEVSIVTILTVATA
jgi:hypothetical protein